MEKNIVILDIEKYEFLRDFHKNIVDGKIFTLMSSNNTCIISKFYTNDEIIQKLTDELTALKKYIDGFEKSNKKYIRDKHNIIDELIEEKKKILKMSYWEFRKWRKSNIKNFEK